MGENENLTKLKQLCDALREEGTRFDGREADALEVFAKSMGAARTIEMRWGKKELPKEGKKVAPARPKAAAEAS
jgi:hypothetical protein